jgi:very-short-patch-repair endonuclease
VLEHGFLTRVLRPHGLLEPSRLQARRQGPAGTEYRDVELAVVEANVELDGSTHDSREQRDLDADRDLADLASGRVTPRLRYPQVFGTPCRTAYLLAAFFRHRGWPGDPVPCSPACDISTTGRIVPP